MVIHSENKLTDRLSRFHGDLIGIDGYAGVGKSTLAERVSAALGRNCVHLDDFLSKNKGGFLECLRYDEVAHTVRRRPAVVEGVCLLAVLEQIGVVPDLLVYVQVPDAIRERMSASDADRQDEPIVHESALNLLREVRRYHEQFDPERRAHILYQDSAPVQKGKSMHSGQPAVDIAFIQAKTKLALALAIGGMLSLLVGLAVLLYGVSGTDETLVRFGVFEVSASGLGGVIMGTSAVWAFFAYKTRPTYAWRREQSEKYDPDSRLVERLTHESSTAVTSQLGTETDNARSCERQSLDPDGASHTTDDSAF